MAELVHAQAALDAASSSNSTTLTTRLTLSAATLSGAGFSTNEDVIVLFFGLFHAAATGTDHVWRLQYNGSTISNGTANPQLDQTGFGASNADSMSYMTRVNLGGTIGDFTLQNQRVGTSANIVIEKARIVVLRCADLGTENTDWYWNKSTTSVAHTTTYSGTNRASITWTPASATDDWVVLMSDHIQVDSTSVNYEGRVMLDGATLVAGDYSEEGEATDEEITHLCVGIMENLSTSSHTITYESRDDTATAANFHRESALLLFRAGRFPDLFWNTPVDNGLAANTDEQIAGITSSLSEAQDALVLASMRVNIGAVDQATWMWVAIGGSTQAPDASSTAIQRANAQSSDTTDDNQCTWMGVLALSSGAQDIELWAETTSSSSATAEEITLILWGLEMGAGAQTVTGSLLTVTPSFPTGSVTAGNVTVDGALLTVTPSFPTGTVQASNTIDGALLTVLPSFPTGSVAAGNVTIDGALLTVAPSFPQGSVTAGNVTIDGVLLSVAPSFPTGSVEETVTIEGILLTVLPTFPTGAVTAGNVTIDGALLTVVPSFPTGTLTATNTIDGALLTVTPTFPTGSVAAGEVVIDGQLLTVSPSFPTGTLIQDQFIIGALLAVTPSFPQGSVEAGNVTIGGDLLTVSPSFPTGTLIADRFIDGILLTVTPSFPTGTLIQGATIGGQLLTVAPSFPTGSVTAGNVNVTGVLLTVSPSFPAGQVLAGEVVIGGILLTVSPSFPTGLLLAAQLIEGNLLTVLPSFPTGEVFFGGITFVIGEVTCEMLPAPSVTDDLVEPLTCSTAMLAPTVETELV